MALSITVHICPGCEEEHDDYDDARYCCMPRESERFECELCGARHRGECDADDCCFTSKNGGSVDNAPDGRKFPDATSSMDKYIQQFNELNGLKS